MPIRPTNYTTTTIAATNWEDDEPVVALFAWEDGNLFEFEDGTIYAWGTNDPSEGPVYLENGVAELLENGQPFNLE